jgi:hypothetical protein
MANGQTNSDKLDFDKVWLMFQETDKQFKETDRQFKETDMKFKETDKKFQETDKKFKETGIDFQELHRLQKETDKQIKELGKQIGGLGNKYGTFTEELFMASIIKTFKRKFGCYKLSPNVEYELNGASFEIDFLASSDDSCYIVEIKSHFTDNVLDQLKKTIENFKKYDKDHEGKQIFGVIAAPFFNKESFDKILKEGFHIVSSANDVAKLISPKGFQAKSW